MEHYCHRCGRWRWLNFAFMCAECIELWNANARARYAEAA